MLLPISRQVFLNSKVIALEILTHDALFEVIDASKRGSCREKTVKSFQSGLAELLWIPVGQVFQAYLALADHFEQA